MLESKLFHLITDEETKAFLKKLGFSVNRGRLLEFLHQIHLLSVDNILSR